MSGAASLALDTACYSYVGVSIGAPPAGARVRVRLTDSGTTELARFLGPRVRSAEGAIASRRDDGALMVAVEWVQLSDGVRQPWSGEGQVTFPAAYVTGVEQRTLDRRRTTIGSIALATSLVAIAVIALKAGGAKGAPGVEGGDPTAR